MRLRYALSVALHSAVTLGTSAWIQGSLCRTVYETPGEKGIGSHKIPRVRNVSKYIAQQ